MGRSAALSDLGFTDIRFTTLLERARALDHEALSVLYSRYLPVVYRAILGRVSDVHLAEDLTSETFFVMVESIERVRAVDELGFVAWLLGIGRNKVAEYYRRQAARPSVRGEIEPWEEPVAAAEAGDPVHVVQYLQRQYLHRGAGVRVGQRRDARGHCRHPGLLPTRLKLRQLAAI
jgi:DNA-directed RNA polymerase specialized sigma24 family protein